MNLSSFHDKLAGVTFEGRQKLIKQMSKDTQLRFRREPDNEYDKDAVAVDALLGDWKHVGYISRDHNGDISKILDAGKHAAIQVSEVTGGGDKNYGVNVYIELEKERDPILPKSAKRCLDIFGNEIFYDDEHHCYMNSLGEVYLSGSAFASQSEKPFRADIISKAVANKYELGKNGANDLQEMWKLKAEVSTSLGTSIHAALELYGRFKGLCEKIGKETYLHDNPVVREVVEAFYEEYPCVDNTAYEALVVDHGKKRAGRIDRIERLEDGVWITDFKTNVYIEKDLPKYWLQLSFYAAILKANGIETRGLKIYHYNAPKWDTYEHDVIDIDKEGK